MPSARAGHQIAYDIDLIFASDAEDSPAMAPFSFMIPSRIRGSFAHDRGRALSDASSPQFWDLETGPVQRAVVVLLRQRPLRRQGTPAEGRVRPGSGQAIPDPALAEHQVSGRSVSFQVEPLLGGLQQ